VFFLETFTFRGEPTCQKSEHQIVVVEIDILIKKCFEKQKREIDFHAYFPVQYYLFDHYDTLRDDNRSHLIFNVKNAREYKKCTEIACYTCGLLIRGNSDRKGYGKKTFVGVYDRVSFPKRKSFAYFFSFLFPSSFMVNHTCTRRHYPASFKSQPTRHITSARASDRNTPSTLVRPLGDVTTGVVPFKRS